MGVEEHSWVGRSTAEFCPFRIADLGHQYCPESLKSRRYHPSISGVTDPDPRKCG